MRSGSVPFGYLTEMRDGISCQFGIIVLPSPLLLPKASPARIASSDKWEPRRFPSTYQKLLQQ